MTQVNSVFTQLNQFRQDYLKEINEVIIGTKNSTKHGPTFTIADTHSSSSVAIANGWVAMLSGFTGSRKTSSGTGNTFENITLRYLSRAFSVIAPGGSNRWAWKIGGRLRDYDQYAHGLLIDQQMQQNPSLKSIIGEDYLITPDITLSHLPVNPLVFGGRGQNLIGTHSPLFTDGLNAGYPFLHANISCKLTFRSDRAQNARTEALNLIRNRKGRTPHIVAVTAEPLPGRLSSLAFGTGDIDCLYHAGLYELVQSINLYGSQDNIDKLSNMIDGRRLRDISDLIFDLTF